MSRKLYAFLAIPLAISSLSAVAKEGMFTPEQLPEISDDLKKLAWRYLRSHLVI